MLYTFTRRFVPLAFLATMSCGLAYLGVQQTLRQSANDPQIQMAEDDATAIQANASVTSTVPTGSVNIITSLSPFVIVYDGNGNPISGNGELNGSLPHLPTGVFDNTWQNGENRVTWEPQSNVRDAIVIARIHHPASLTDLPTFVMAGRSLREVENRETNLEFIMGIIWLSIIIGLFVLELIFAFVEARWFKRK